MKSTITVTDIRIHANHGCMEEEALIGAEYTVDVTVTADLQRAAATDTLTDTVDYVHINRIVTEEMAQRSKLLEHVNQRILNRLAVELPLVENAVVTVRKLSPPINGNVAAVAVTMHLVR